MISLTLPGKPIAKKRPRFTRVRKGVKTYSAQSEEDETMRWQIKSRLEGQSQLEGPLEVIMTFYMPIPKSASKALRAKMVSGEARHVTKPDVDNLGKKALDCMNGLVFYDDRQVVKLTLEKQYGEKPRTEITIICVES